MNRLRQWFVHKGKVIKRDVSALMLCYADQRTPWYAKAWSLLVIGYAISPIDFIPDIIPVVGLLDDFLPLPLGVWVAVKLIPKEVWAACREQAAQPDASGANQLTVGYVFRA